VSTEPDWYDAKDDNGDYFMVFTCLTRMSRERNRVMPSDNEAASLIKKGLANFAQACAHDVSKEFKRTAAAQLEEAVIRLNDYILRNIIPPDINENHAVTPTEQRGSGPSRIRDPDEQEDACGVGVKARKERLRSVPSSHPRLEPITDDVAFEALKITRMLDAICI
jgi:hypothetical protein